MSKSQNHYEILGVSPQADIDAIKAAYREQIRKHHPDKYTGERARIARQGGSLDAIDRRIRRAQQTTQQINAAYAVLGDHKKRYEYDKQRRNARLQRQHPDTAYDEWRSAVQRPAHRHYAPENRPPTIAEEAFPWAVLATLMILLLVGFSFVGDFLWSIDTTDRRIDRTAIGLDANEIQATTNSRYATQYARETRVAEPTIEPLSAAGNLRAAERLRQGGLYNEALELYNAAINDMPGATAPYLERGQTYRRLYETSDDISARSAYYEAALADFSRVIDGQTQDSDKTENRVMAYEKRGLLHYARWQQTGDENMAAAARDDLLQVQALVADEAELALSAAAQDALAGLPD